jgi:ATP-binding cassette subfamily C (CFTR/MRP) protein 1
VVYAGPVLSVVIPRLLFVGFTFAQPFLLNTIVDAVGASQLTDSTAGGLIGATVLIYLGIGVRNFNDTLGLKR